MRVFKLLEREQGTFLSKESLFRSREYVWPRDSLHWWSRVWEYPYVYYHLKKVYVDRQRLGSIRVVDLGSGVTFFPFSVARMGCHVTCVDNDPVCGADMNKAIALMPHSPGIVDFCLAHGGDVPFEDATIDMIYCISVLEHVPSVDEIVNEMARVLKPGGILILTFDIALRGIGGICRKEYECIPRTLTRHFEFCVPVVRRHPGNMLVSSKNNILMRSDGTIKGLDLWFRERLVWSLLARVSSNASLLTVGGFVVRRLKG
jgi:SAM-dependent methyltransferase